MNLSSGASQIGSGVVYAVGGYGVMGIAAAAMAVVPLGFAVWWQIRGRLAPSVQVQRTWENQKE